MVAQVCDFRLVLLIAGQSVQCRFGGSDVTEGYLGFGQGEEDSRVVRVGLAGLVQQDDRTRRVTGL